MSELNCDIIIPGDFNIDWCKDNFNKNKMQCLLHNNGLKQVIEEFTRITQGSKTLIDFIIANSSNIQAKTNISNKILDHEAIDIIVDNMRDNTNGIDYKEIDIFKYDNQQYNRVHISHPGN